MESPSPRHKALTLALKGFSDTFLQIRTKPLTYFLLWLCLVLGPYLILGLAFSKAIAQALTDFLDMSQILVDSGLEPSMLPAETSGPFLKLLFFYALIWGLINLAAIYTGAVLSESVRQFRDRTLPEFMQIMTDGASRFLEFFKSVIFAAVKILWKPLATLTAGIILGLATNQMVLASVGFFAGMILFFSELCRFGLGPFIHLSLGVSGKDACLISREYFLTNRPVISSLFLTTVLAPAMLILLLFSFFMNMGIYFGVGSIILWFFQSIVQFIVVMSLVNFAMNTFVPSPAEDSKILPKENP